MIHPPESDCISSKSGDSKIEGMQLLSRRGSGDVISCEEVSCISSDSGIGGMEDMQ